MVVLYNTNLKIDTTKLLETLPLNEQIIKVEKRGILKRGESSRDKIKRRSKKEKAKNKTGFGHNSITIVMMSNGDGKQRMKEITIKIFQNGVFHLTGVLHDSYDQECMKYLCNTIFECPDAIIDKPPAWETIKRRVVLMNYTSQLSPKTTISREKFYNSVRHDEGLSASYNPDVYPGVKLQFMPSKWTAKIFRTGKIILTGITTHEDCEEFVRRLNILLLNYLRSLEDSWSEDSLSEDSLPEDSLPEGGPNILLLNYLRTKA